MADPVSIIGTVVGVASLAIQSCQILQEYCSGVSDFQKEVKGLLAEANQLSDVLKQLEDFLKRDGALSRSFTNTSTLYSANIQCELRLTALIQFLKHQSEGSKARKAFHALKWPMGSRETRRIALEIRGYTQTFQFALSIEGCNLLKNTSEEVSEALQKTSDTLAAAEKATSDITAIRSAVASLPQSVTEIEKSVAILEAKALSDVDQKALDWLSEPITTSKHHTIRKLRSKNTGNWFFEGPSYQAWRNGFKPLLWCEGKPGAGKTVLVYAASNRVVTC